MCRGTSAILHMRWPTVHRSAIHRRAAGAVATINPMLCARDGARSAWYRGGTPFHRRGATMTDILRELSPATLAAAIEANEVAYWLYHVHVAGWELIEEPGITSYLSGRPEMMRNGVFFTDLAPDVANDAIAATIEHFHARDLPFVWWGGPSRRPRDLGRRLLAQGLVLCALDPALGSD